MGEKAVGNRNWSRRCSAEGADPSCILIGHMDGKTDVGYHIRGLQTGRSGGSSWPNSWESWYITHVFDSIIPQLKEKGVTDEQIDQIMVKNLAAVRRLHQVGSVADLRPLNLFSNHCRKSDVLPM